MAQGGSGERLIADRVFGVIGGVMVLLGLVFLVRSFMEGGSDTGSGPASAVPQIRIVSPAVGAALAQPASVEFDAGAPLVLGPTGWTAAGRHLHLFAGGTEMMASANEITAVQGTRYRWALPRLPPGSTTLRMTWSGANHQSIPQGASQTIPVTLR
ncbi:hypothetical protein [Longimicrobium sp.]|jgi:hypothetical protein|uniref:hypothetical protein n=1 Tax=Longimicrobium sp. TaxID=2029185 RepID=UPI002F95B281